MMDTNNYYYKNMIKDCFMNASGSNGRTPSGGAGAGSAGATHHSVVGNLVGNQAISAAEKPKYTSTDSASRLQRVWRAIASSLPLRKTNLSHLQNSKYGCSSSEFVWLENLAKFLRENGFPDFEMKEHFYDPLGDDTSTEPVMFIYDRCVDIQKILGKGTPQQILTLLNQLSCRNESRQEVTIDIEADRIRITSYYVRITSAKNEYACAKTNVESARNHLTAAQVAQPVQNTSDEYEDDWEKLADESVVVNLPEEAALTRAIEVKNNMRLEYNRILGELKNNIRVIASTCTLTRNEKSDFFKSIYHPILLEMNDVIPIYIIDALKRVMPSKKRA